MWAWFLGRNEMRERNSVGERYSSPGDYMYTDVIKYTSRLMVGTSCIWTQRNLHW